MNPSSNPGIVVIGAGIVGLAVALDLTSRLPGTPVTVVEKEVAIARHQTSHNSGVIHSGIYYKPGGLKATLCVTGAQAMQRFCEENAIPYGRCGKVIVATGEEELTQLEELYRRGHANGLRHIRMLGPEEIREHEPAAAGIRGIYVPDTAIVDYRRVAESYAELITQRGGQVQLGHEVTGFRHLGSTTIVATTGEAISARLVINCAGLQSDRISRLAGVKLGLTIVPFRGEYYELTPASRHLVKALLYPVPNPQFPFLGVHFTRNIAGDVEAGPNAVLAWHREGYAKNAFQWRDVQEYASFPGFWRMASKHWRMSIGEYHRSWSKAAFVRALQRLLPEITGEDLVVAGAGVRAQALTRQGTLLDDFHIVQSERMVHVANVPSPAATASLAIARYITDTALRDF